MRKAFFASSAVAALIVAVPGLALAQTTTTVPVQQPAQQQVTPQQTVTATGQQQVAEQCLQDLQVQAQRMQQDAFWATGWGTRWGGWGPAWGAAGTPAGTGLAGSATVGTPAVQPPGITGAPGTVGAGAPPATVPGAAGAPAAGVAAGTAPTGGTVAGAWGRGMAGFDIPSPRQEVRVLFQAADVLARRGDEQACQVVLASLIDTYEDYVLRMREAGVEPAQVETWREEQLALARPVTEVEGIQAFAVDNLIGADVRNPQDEDLGSVDDIILNEQGGIGYVAVARGGFLGIGEDHVLVPWEAFSIAPGMNALVLNVTEDRLEAAPTVNPEAFEASGGLQQQRRDLDAYWR